MRLVVGHLQRNWSDIKDINLDAEFGLSLNPKQT